MSAFCFVAATSSTSTAGGRASTYISSRPVILGLSSSVLGFHFPIVLPDNSPIFCSKQKMDHKSNRRFVGLELCQVLDPVLKLKIHNSKPMSDIMITTKRIGKTSAINPFKRYQPEVSQPVRKLEVKENKALQA